MKNSVKNTLKEVMNLAWSLIKKNGFSRAEALKTAWANIKLKAQMKVRIVRFTFKKVDGTLREAFGTLKESLLPQTNGTGRKQNDSLQTYWDTEKESFRCFKKANLISVSF